MNEEGISNQVLSLRKEHASYGLYSYNLIKMSLQKIFYN